eukprot:COSAG06_NODE_2292_length_7145_cov_10.060176_4_plen_182_part_00
MHSAIPIFQCFNVMKTVPFVFVLIYRYKTIAWQDRLRTNVCTGEKDDGKERGGVGVAHRCKCPRVPSHRACKRFRCSSSPETENRSPLASTLSRMYVCHEPVWANASLFFVSGKRSLLSRRERSVSFLHVREKRFSFLFVVLYLEDGRRAASAAGKVTRCAVRPHRAAATTHRAAPLQPTP